ncbi:Hsp70 family protein [Mycolicibacterium goodii]|uniref:Molecular chaperone n=1 Tax=Mycolicibacterium goodii TaxID=134601 RepID=A0A0K0X829_MYCGD|nr:molecular chaperone [Mycolicibacterium goodii]
MVDGTGLSIGATGLTAVHVGRAAVTRSPVLTRYPHRPSEVGVPSENPNLTERGLILTDFVDRVGDPVGIVAADGSTHRGEVLVAEALGALLAALSGGRPAGPVAITHPAHWRPDQVDALGAALGPEFRGAPLVADATAALTALQDDPGVPTRGIIAVCDFGGSGTSITLADADDGYRPIAPAVRHADLSGALIDQALLTHVVDDLSAAGTIDLTGTSAIGSLSRLRAECRRAKERLSTESATTLVAELPAHRSDVRLTRTELDEVLRAPLAEFVAVLQDTLERNGLPPGALAAVATIGGGARIPAITTTLSEHLRVPVITAAQPELTAAIGGGLIAARGTVRDDATALAPAASDAEAAGTATMAAALVAPEPPAAPQALAWSDAEDVPDVAPLDDFADEAPASSVYGPRPQVRFADPEPAEPGGAQPWYRRRAAVVGAGAAAVLAVVAAVALVGNRDSGDVAVPAATDTPATTTSSAPAAPPAAVEQQPAPAQTVTEVLPPPETPQSPETVVQTVTPAPVEPPAPTTTEAPPPTTTEAPPPTTTEAPPPTTTEAPTSTPPRWSPTAPYPTIPGLPWVPAPQLPGAPAN